MFRDDHFKSSAWCNEGGQLMPGFINWDYSRAILGLASPRSDNSLRVILGLSFCVLSTFSNPGLTNLGITQLSL